MNKARGLFITVEGIDRSGKTTQCRLIADKLKEKGIRVEIIRYPVRESETGRVIDKYLKGEITLSPKEAHELFAKNRTEHKEEVWQKLMAGVTLIVDRYSYSGIVYSVAKGLSWSECVSTELGLVAPDLVFYLNLTPEDAATRSDYGAEIFETVSFQNRVYEAYQTLIRANQWMVIDAKQEVSCITEQMTAVISATLSTAAKDVLVFSERHFSTLSDLDSGRCIDLIRLTDQCRSSIVSTTL